MKKRQQSDNLWCLVCEIDVCYSFMLFETVEKSYVLRAPLHHETSLFL